MARWRSEGEGQSANLKGWGNQRCSDLPLMAVGHSHFLPLRMGWTTSVAICYLVSAGVPGRPGQEFRRGCYPTWHPSDFGEALWCGGDIWFSEQRALFPQTRTSRKCGWIWSVIIAAGPDTPVGVSWKDPTGACRGNEEGLLLWGPEPQMSMNASP